MAYYTHMVWKTPKREKNDTNIWNMSQTPGDLLIWNQETRKKMNEPFFLKLTQRFLKLMEKFDFFLIVFVSWQSHSGPHIHIKLYDSYMYKNYEAISFIWDIKNSNVRSQYWKIKKRKSTIEKLQCQNMLSTNLSIFVQTFLI